MSSQSFIGDVLKGFSDAFQPLEESLASIDEFGALLSSFGWALDTGGNFGQVTSALKPVKDSLDAVDKAVQAMEALGPSPSADQMGSVIPPLVKAIKDLIKAIRLLAKGPTFQGPPPSPLEKPEFWAGFGQELVEWLLYTYVRDHQPALFGFLHFLGVLSEEQVTTTGVPFRRPYLRRGVQWDRIPMIVGSPRSLFDQVYGWGTAFDQIKFLGNLAKLFGAFELPVQLLPAPSDLLDIYYDSKAGVRDHVMLLRNPVYSAAVNAGSALGYVEADLGLMAIPPTGSTTAEPAGFSVFPMILGEFSGTFQVFEGIYLDLGGGFESDGAIRAEIRPDGVNVVATNALPNTPIDAHAIFSAKPATPWILIGAEDSTRLQLSSCHLSLSAKGKVGDLEYVIELGADKAALILDIGEGDGFLQGVLGGKPQTLDLSTMVSWSNKFGLHLSGQAQLQATLPIHVSIAGILLVNTMYIKFQAGADTKTVILELSVAGGLSLGPVSVAVDRVGLETDIVALDPKTDDPGNLGDLDFQFKFKPPNGLGLSIDAQGMISGGGFIDLASDEYTGLLDVCIAQIIQVKFIAIVDTIHNPDGSKGYSFLFIIFLAFGPIQIGYGFTLNGVGGIAGLNRSISQAGLDAGLRNHTLDYVINPPQKIAEASKAISAANTFFPPANGRYVFGPILQIGWETFLKVTVGVILEVPDPVTFVLLGIIDVALPSTDVPDAQKVTKIHIDVLGQFYIPQKKLSIDGRMYDSHLLTFPILGDMALRVAWGSSPNFLCSFGGFDPKFNTTGLDVPPLNRLSISIGNGDSPRLSATAYFALTSNTVQFGASVEAFAQEAGFSVHGFLGFDVLIIVSPFSFEFDFAAEFDVSYQGTSLAGLNVTGVLSGPRPWHFHGDATIHILCFSVGASVDLQWGEKTPITLPSSQVLPDLVGAPDRIGELGKPQNWSAVLPDGMTPSVTLSNPMPDASTVVVHPMGALSVRQTCVPLDIQISRYKNAVPSDGNYFKIGQVQINGNVISSESYEPSKEYFAIGQFLDLPDADKLSRPSFEKYDAGIKITSSVISQGQASSRTVTYRECYIYDPNASSKFSRFYYMSSDAQLAVTHLGAGYQSPLKNTGFAKYQTGPLTPAVTVKDPPYVIATVDNMSIRSDIADAKGTTYYQARQALNLHLAQNPQDAGNLQILPFHEAMP